MNPKERAEWLAANKINAHATPSPADANRDPNTSKTRDNAWNSTFGGSTPGAMTPGAGPVAAPLVPNSPLDPSKNVLSSISSYLTDTMPAAPASAPAAPQYQINAYASGDPADPNHGRNFPYNPAAAANSRFLADKAGVPGPQSPSGGMVGTVIPDAKVYDPNSGTVETQHDDGQGGYTSTSTPGLVNALDQKYGTRDPNGELVAPGSVRQIPATAPALNPGKAIGSQAGPGNMLPNETLANDMIQDAAFPFVGAVPPYAIAAMRQIGQRPTPTVDTNPPAPALAPAAPPVAPVTTQAPRPPRINAHAQPQQPRPQETGVKVGKFAKKHIFNPILNLNNQLEDDIEQEQRYIGHGLQNFWKGLTS